uniref:Nuclear envelope pore membrane protein POM 121-like n=1 Tax=Sinocyclocheilus grahami TaxID=75366 RepID=A0A672N8R9_SINGR
MSPEDKRRLIVFSAVVFSLFLLLLVLSYIPAYLYILFICVVSCVVYFHKAEELQLFERLGLNPRRGLSVPSALLRWLPGRTLSGVPAAGRNKIRKSDARNSFASPSDRHFAGSYYRRDHTLSESVFSPRDILMGSYLAKTEESPSAAVRPTGGSGAFMHPRDQLRDRLARPNHAVHTPNRRLSFGDPVGTASRFTITPQRHYPLQQTGTSPIGVIPPAKWDGFCKKNVLTQRNSPAVHSPVTVKIAKPDPTRSSFFDHLNSPGVVKSPGIGAQADPCSREAVLSVLRESRKREVDEEDKSASSGQKSKRRRHDSSGSSQSAFEPLLANGAPSQLVPKPGSLKRGMNSSLNEESIMKRSRTSSISSVSGAPVPSGVPGSVRNSIRSSYSSSQGYPQRRAASSLSLSPFTSPGGSRCQTPERAAKKASISNPLLESLKNMKNNPLLSAPTLMGTTTAAPAVSVSSLSTPASATNPSSGLVKSESGPTALQPLFSTPSSISTPASKPATSMPSAFAQILAQPLKPLSSMPSLGGGGSLFSLIKPVATSASEPPKSTVTALTTTVASVNSISNPLSSGFKPIFGAASTTPASTAEVKPTQPTFKPLFGTGSGISTFGQTATPTTSTPAAPVSQNSGMLFGGLTSTQPVTVSASSAAPITQTPSPSLFGSWTATVTSAPATNTTFQFGATSTTTAAPTLNTNTTNASSTTSAFQFGAAKPAPAPQVQSTFTFGQVSANQNSTSAPFGGFGITSSATTSSETPTTQTTFRSSAFTASSSFPASTKQTPAAAKPFTFGAGSGSSGTSPFVFGAAASTAAPAFGTNSQPTFGGAGFSFGNTTTPSAAPVFGASTQTVAPLPAPAPTFTFGGASTATQNPAPSTPAPPASGGFNFGASLSATPFGTLTPAAQTPGFSFGANNTDNKPAFGASTPAFGQASAGMSVPFGSPGTPGFGAVGASPFGSSPATFSIGTGSKSSGARRLQARRQHPRKK